MSESIKLQQEAIYEMLSTEVSYIRQILTMTDIFMTSVLVFKSSLRDGLLTDIDTEKLFSNIQDVLNSNLSFWKEILLPIKLKLEQTGCAMNPSDLKNGFRHVSRLICLLFSLSFPFVHKRCQSVCACASRCIRV
jgi:pleckstrin homology domain-containing family G member 5